MTRRAPIATDDGFVPYLVQPAPRGVLVRFWREYTGEQWTGYADELVPEFNVADLWWKPTGIAKEMQC